MRISARPGTHILAVSFIVAFLVPIAWSDTFYVSPSGNDANPGTKVKPFATLERARDAIRSVPPSRPRNVLLQEGMYRISASLVLGPEDSGTAQTPAVWQAAPGEMVRFVGGTRLTDWQPVQDASVQSRLSPEARGRVVQCDLGALGIDKLGTVQPQSGIRTELFFDRRYMTLARYPNDAWLEIADVPSDAQFKFQDKDDPNLVRHRGPFQYGGNRPERWKDTADLWIHGYWTYDWADEYEPVERVEVEKSLIWPKPPYHGYGYTKGHRYYFLNVLEELDQPGEWYLDRKERILYFWPPDKLETAEAMFPDFEQPMVVLDNASHVSLRGIVFECSRAEAVIVKGGTCNEIAGCVVRNVGRTAIDVQGGTNHVVRSCDVYETASGGVALKGGDRASLTPGGHLVTNCEIHHFARVQKTYHPAVALNGVGNRMTHCYIHDAPHMGVGYDGNDHTIEYCEFTRIAYETGDVGVTYAAMDWTYMGHLFRYNYFHQIHGPGELGCFTIYPDLPCGGIHLYGNVFFDVDQGFLTNSGRGMTIENNLFLRCARTFRFNVWGDMRMFKPGGPWRMAERLEEVEYDQPPYSTRYPVLARLAEDFAKSGPDEIQRTIPKDNLIRCNVSTGPHFLGLGAQASLDDVKVEKNLIANSVVMTGSPNGDGHSTTYRHDDPAIQTILAKTGNIVGLTDPGIADPDAEDFRLRKDSPARKLGFKPIPFDEIGLQTDSYRKHLPLRAPVFVPFSKTFVDETEVRLVPCRRGGPAVIRYTLDGTDPTSTSPKYHSPIRLTQATTIKTAAFAGGARGTEQSETASAVFRAAYLGAGNGVFLSDLEESEYIGPDGLGSAALLKDKAQHNHPIRLGGIEYQKGLVTTPAGMPDGAFARLTYALEGPLAKAQRFTAQIGLEEQAASGNGTCVFTVEARRNGEWQRVFDSGEVSAQEAPRSVNVEIAGAARLRLTASASQAVWADAKLE